MCILAIYMYFWRNVYLVALATFKLSFLFVLRLSHVFSVAPNSLCLQKDLEILPDCFFGLDSSVTIFPWNH